jgi:protein ImuB
LAPPTIELLQRLGVERIVQLLALPRDGLATRLGEEVLKRLDQALGSSAEMLVSYHAPQRFHAEWTLEHATDRQEVILQVVEHLSHHLASLLRAQDQGAVQIRCQLRCQTVAPLQMEIGFFRPTACADHFCQLLQMQLDSCRLPGPVAAVHLEAIHTARLSHQQQEMWNDPAADRPEQLAMLVDRLSSRLGPSAVLAARLRAGALPEDAYVVIPLTGPESSAARLSASSGHRSAPRPGQRPVLLFRSPLPVEVVCVAPDGPPIWFHHLGRKQQVGRHWGPERIETSWWQGPCIRRDYYQVECTSGCRFWLFRRLDDQTWFLQG